jgi:hypothetical protein
MMCPAIDNPASCEIHDVIRFLHAKNMSAAEIHQKRECFSLQRQTNDKCNGKTKRIFVL